jgi:hypothetical protein
LQLTVALIRYATIRGVVVAKHQTEIHGKRVERVGAIIVHGIGEQKRFEFLEGETRKIVDAVIAKYDAKLRRRYVTPTLTMASADPFLGSHSSWASGAEAPLHIIVELDNGQIVDIAFHEVWWADINETLTLGKQIRFWLWGLSLAGIATHNTPFLPGVAHTRQPNNAETLTWWHRLRMGYISILFGFSACSIAVINMFLKRLSFRPVLSTDVIVNYLSAVKLYSQDKRAGGGTMDGPDEPPRAAIRRRMIRAMIDVATQGYHRWYILAHSQGAIVAWNGLMESAESLPNYLDQTTWNTLAGNPLRGVSADPIDVSAMLPNRPVWVDNHGIINRDALFEKFRGVLTYGSPLERFCALWSVMVPINKHEDPYRVGTEWVNVYDPTDPVGTWISNFNPLPLPPARTGHAKLTPHNFPCRASPILLLSHICYLTASRLSALRLIKDDAHLLVNLVADWLVHGDSLASRISAAPRSSFKFWMPLAAPGVQPYWQTRPRVIWRFIQWGIAGAALTLITLLFIHDIIWPLAQRGLTWWKNWSI